MADSQFQGLALRPRRRTSRGAIRLDMTMMILSLLTCVGLCVWVLIEHNNYNKDKGYVERAHLAAQRPGLALNAAEEAAKRLSAVIGFNGNGRTSLDLLENRVQSMMASKIVMHGFADGATIGGEDPTKSVLRRSGAGFVGVSRKEAESYLPKQNDLKLQDVFDYQNRSTLNHVELLKTWHKARVWENKYTLDAAAKAGLEKGTILSGANDTVKNNVSSVETAHGEAKGAMNRARESMQGATSKADQLQKDVQDAQANLGERITENEMHRFTAAEERERFITMLSERVLDRAKSNDSVGAILQVDREGRWVWINLGQAENIRPEMSFFVFHRSEGGESERQIAEIQVKEVLNDGMSRCRIISVASNELLPAPGDTLRKPNFASRMYTRYAFVGKFGGKFTRFSRDQLTEKLRELGFLVQAKPDVTTEVLILGGEFLDDAQYQAVAASDPPIIVERMTEEEILYMLGLIGPVSKR